MKKAASSVVGAIGKTPVVRLSRVVESHGIHGSILAKLEYLNPGFSKKDRIALQIIQDAEEAGKLLPGQTVVELTSGNTGTGLAIVCAVKGYPFVAIMSKGNSEERAKMMRALGAEVILVDQLPSSVKGQVSGGDLELVALKADQVTRERHAFRADQFRLQSNFRAHFLQTGPEFLEQAEGQIDAFCDFVGTGGTFAGCSAAFKQYNPGIRCYIIEPEGAAVLAGAPITEPNHPIQGGGYCMQDLPLINSEHIDGYLQVSASEALNGARQLARLEGIFAGFSSGANLAAALKLLKGDLKGGTVAIVICDSGLKYLSTGLWSSEYDSEA